MDGKGVDGREVDGREVDGRGVDGKGNEPWIPSIVSIGTHSCYGNHDKFRGCGH